MFRIIFLLFTLLGLTACATPMRLGMSEAEWQNYSPEEQQKIKSGYYEMLKSRMRAEEKAPPDGSTLNVRISGGQVAMPPFTNLSSYSSLELNIPNGDCQTFSIKDQNGSKQVPLKVCYLDKTLYIDPSHYDPDKRLGSIQLHYSPIWDRGFTYQNVSSSGYAHLSNVNVAVKKFGTNESDDSTN